MDILMRPIGYIRSPYQTREETPKCGTGNTEVTGEIVLEEQYMEGIADLVPGNQYYLFFYFHKSTSYKLTVHIHGDGPLRSLFASHSPNRPNGIGLSIITVVKIEENRIYFTGVDMFDGTPVLDIKPC